MSAFSGLRERSSEFRRAWSAVISIWSSHAAGCGARVVANHRVSVSAVAGCANLASARGRQQRRDTALVAWRVTYDAIQTGKAPPSQEVAAQQRYYAARQEVESALKALKARYGSTDNVLRRAMEARQRS